MTSGGRRPLSTPLSEVSSHYPWVVVGSGYGASISACRLSRAGQSVLVIERGKELHPGEFPSTWEQAKSELRLTLPDGSIYGPRSGFFDMTMGDQGKKKKKREKNIYENI